jgi:tetraacyldisaccharide 4'-kinase
VDRAASAEEVGDEAVLLARLLAGVADVVVARDRVRGVALAAAAGARVIILDDAMQTWRVARDLNVVALDTRRPLGTGRLFPAGDLREPRSGLSRADIAVLTRTADASADERRATEEMLRRAAPDVPCAATDHRTIHRTGPPIDGRRVWLVTGVANPSSVRRGVTALGAEVAGHTAAPDHHRLTRVEIRAIAARARRTGVHGLVITDKDAARHDREELRAFDMPLTVAGVEIVWLDGRDVLLERLAGAMRARSSRPL